MAKDAYYFPHDSNAKDDPKCTLLIEELGLEGYGIYWVLIEILRDQENYKYPIKLIPSLARKYNTTAKKIEGVVKRYGLFEMDNDSFFFSEPLIKRMAKINERRAALSEAGKRGNEKRWKNNIGLSSPPESPRDSHPIASKVKKIKEKEIKENTLPIIFEFGNITPQEFLERYRSEPQYKDGIQLLATQKYTSKENILLWAEKFRTKMIIEAIQKPMPEFVSYFNNWLNMHYNPDIDPSENKNPNTKKMVY